jgi:hypothetical protein
MLSYSWTSPGPWVASSIAESSGSSSESRRKEEGTIRNDRLIVVAVPSHTHADLKRVADLNATLLEELEKFFVNYHAIDGEKYRVIGCKGPGKALKLVAEAAHRWTKQEKKGAKAGKS